MIIGSIKEHTKEETRTALTPAVIKKLTTLGHTILIEKSIGKKSFFFDNEYLKAGAKFSTPEKIYKNSDIILQIAPPPKELLSSLNTKQIIASNFHQYTLTPNTSKATIIQLEKIQRTSVGQSIDILSSQHTVRGYASALYALSHSPIMAPQIFTSATSIKQTTALVIGASITGLQASITFKRNGCKVILLDINDKNQELARSVGAELKIVSSPKELEDLLHSSNIILASAQTITSSPQIISQDNIKSITKGTIIIDTTSNNIEISSNLKNTPNYYFYRNLYFERLIPITSSTLWANNMLNLITTISLNNTINLEIDYIKPMIFN